ncbi:MAG: LysE family transporter [Methanomassiliicoccales archaeon]
MLDGSPLIFLASVAIISISGVLMPGPVFAATVAEGYRDPRAGIAVAEGHALVEIPLIILIFVGFDTVLSNAGIIAAVGILGGAVLLSMAIDMLRSRQVIVSGEAPSGKPFRQGIITTITNPYWMLWWATIGAALVASAAQFRSLMLPAFISVHIMCDVGWLYLIGRIMHGSRKVWNVRWHHLLIVASGVITGFFALYFILSGIAVLAA